MQNKFSIKEAISFGWHQFFGNWKFWLIAFLISAGVSSFNLGNSTGSNYKKEYQKVLGTQTSNVLPSNSAAPEDTSLFTPQNPQVTSTPVLQNFSRFLLVLIPLGLVFGALAFAWIILSAAVSTILKMGYFHLTFDTARGNPLSYKTLLSDVSVKKALRLIGLNILYFLIVFAGFLFFILPGIYFALKYAFAPFVFVDKNVTIGEAFKISSKMTKGNKLQLLSLWIVSCFLLLGGFLCFFFGVIPASIIVGIAFSYVYVKVADANQPAVSQPTDSVQPLQTPAM